MTNKCDSNIFLASAPIEETAWPIRTPFRNMRVLLEDVHINHICRPMRAQILLPDCVLPVSRPEVEAAAEGGYIDKAPILPTKFYT